MGWNNPILGIIHIRAGKKHNTTKSTCQLLQQEKCICLAHHKFHKFEKNLESLASAHNEHKHVHDSDRQNIEFNHCIEAEIAIGSANLQFITQSITYVLQK